MPISIGEPEKEEVEMNTICRLENRLWGESGAMPVKRDC